jgi:NTE family protein
MSPLQRGLMDRLLGNWSLDKNPVYLALDVASRFLSPYDTNPFDINPLRQILEREVDFDAVRAGKEMQLFVSATNARTGKGRIFSGAEISSDAVMASACLPFLFRAVEIDGVPYWDGAYASNPPLYPLLRGRRSDDIVLVQTNPLVREKTPRTARDILNRVNEITFNASLYSELRAIGSAGGRHGMLSWTGPDHPVRLHRIAADGELKKLTSGSRFTVDWSFFQHLRDIGRKAADDFLRGEFAAIGRRGTLDLRKELA